jgi:hypothetical protein
LVDPSSAFLQISAIHLAAKHVAGLWLPKAGAIGRQLPKASAQAQLR